MVEGRRPSGVMDRSLDGVSGKPEDRLDLDSRRDEPLTGKEVPAGWFPTFLSPRVGNSTTTDKEQRRESRTFRCTVERAVVLFGRVSSLQPRILCVNFYGYSITPIDLFLTSVRGAGCVLRLYTEPP